MVGAPRTADTESGIALRLLTALALSTFVGAVEACASPGSPPGGPVDTQAPKIVRVAPDSAKTSVTPREVIFQFDEVVNERPSGAPSLNALFLISPRNGETQADWHRSEIAVRPRKGFKANTTYTISLLPGLSDLRGNTRNTGATTVFSTGPTLATGRIAGTLFNWAEGRIVPHGLIEARPAGDTATVYLAASDSSGTFVLRNVPPGRYNVRGVSDDNSNHALDPREPFDTSIVNLTDSSNVELLAYVHDSIGARLSSVNARDSVTLELNFDNPISVTNPVTSASIRVRAPDSTDVPIVSVSGPPTDTTASPLPDSIRARIRKPSRPVPLRTLIVKLARPLKQKATYLVRVTDVQNLIGVARTSEKQVTLAAPVVAPPPVKPTVTPPPPPPAVKPPGTPKQ
jgi:Big-like domain-containing protein